MEARNIGSAADIYQTLTDSRLFSRVELSGTVTNCYDSEGNLIVKADGNVNLYGYADAEHSIPNNSLGSITHAYLCQKGVILAKYYSNHLNRIFVLTKTNTGNAAMVFLDVGNSEWNAVTWGDVLPLTGKEMIAVQSNQYALLPFVTNAALGVESFTPDAFYSAVNTGNLLPRSFTIRNERWFAIGNAVLRDNPEN